MKWANSSACYVGKMLKHPHACKQANSPSLCLLPTSAEIETNVQFMDPVKYLISPHFTTFFPQLIPEYFPDFFSPS